MVISRIIVEFCLIIFPECSNHCLVLNSHVIPFCSPQERANVNEQQNVLRQLEAILAIHKLARSGNQLDALREIARLPFLPLDPRSADFATGAFQNISPHVEACVPGLLKDALNCLDNVTDTDGSLRAMRAKVKTAVYFIVDCYFCNYYDHCFNENSTDFADRQLSC